MTAAKQAGVLLLLFVTVTLMACGDDDDPATPPGVSVGKVSGAMVPYTSIQVELVGYPQGSMLLLRSGYWNPGELLQDPQATVTRLSEASFNVEFTNLDRSRFIAPDAQILLVVVDSASDELSGVVVLCDQNGPIRIGTECAGDCVPDCGLPGVGCGG